MFLKTQKDVEMESAEETNKYIETCQKTFWQDVFRTETDYLIAHLENSRDILSVGCGPAFIEGELSKKGFHVTGLDISAEALKCAPDSIRGVAGRAEDMPFPESSFDAVIFVASLQFIGDYKAALRGSLDVLRTGGKIIVMLLNPQSNFFKTMRAEPESYVNLIKHTNIKDIERFMSGLFSIQKEYILGINGETIFKSADPYRAALYVINGRKNKTIKREDKP